MRIADNPGTDKFEFILLLALCATVPQGIACAQSLFSPTLQRVSLEDVVDPIGTVDAVSLAFGDLDGDGLDDAVCAVNDGLNNVSAVAVLPATGAGHFTGPILYPQEIDWETCDAELGDFDADGDLDVAAANGWDHSVSIFANTGDGTLERIAVLPVGLQPRALLALDVDADDDLDLVAMNTESDDLSVLLNDGDGSFAPEKRYVVGNISDRTNPNLFFPSPGPEMAAGDLDADGDLDLVIPTNGSARVMLNEGGAFEPGAEIDTVGFAAYGVEVADFDADAHLDVAVSTTFEFHALSVALGNGNGTFGETVAYAPVPGNARTGLTGADFDGDGDVDLAMAGEFSDWIHVVWNDGDGTFDTWQVIPTLQRPWVAQAHDVDHDGWPDLPIVISHTRSRMAVHLNDANGSLIVPDLIGFEVQFGGNHVSTGDVDGDADPDAVGNVLNGHVLEVFENVDGALADSIPIDFPETAWLTQVVIADMNGDRLDDLVVADLGPEQGIEGPGAVWVALNAGGLEFDLGVTPLEGRFAPEVGVADLDADDDPDVVVVTKGEFVDGPTPVLWQLHTLLNEGGELSLHATYDLGIFDWDIHLPGLTLADFDADGAPDAVVALGPEEGAGFFGLFTGDGAGGFGAPLPIDTPEVASNLAAGDLDGDGDPDLVARLGVFPILSMGVFRNDAGVLSLAQTVSDHGDVRPLRKITLDDMDLDGALDVVTAEASGGAIIYLNDGDGLLSDPLRFVGAGISGASEVATADFDADGAPDILIRSLPELSLLTNRLTPCPADVNADGDLDILDFVAFQLLWQTEDPSADCNADGAFDELDFACFKQQFLAGCD